MFNVKKKLNKKTALIKAEGLCARQEKCESEIKSKLLDWGLNTEETNEILELLITRSFIDNHRYAKAFVREKSTIGKWGKIKIEFALKQKHIQPCFIKTALEEINETNYDTLLEKELSAKLKSIKSKNVYEIKSKLIRFGISRGYENGKVFDKVNKIIKDSFSDKF
jgi:regulatory protein